MPLRSLGRITLLRFPERCFPLPHHHRGVCLRCAFLSRRSVSNSGSSRCSRVLLRGHRHKSTGLLDMILCHSLVGTKPIAFQIAIRRNDVHIDIGVNLMLPHVPKKFLSFKRGTIGEIVHRDAPTKLPFELIIALSRIGRYIKVYVKTFVVP